MKVDGKRISIPHLGWVKMREALRFQGTVIDATVSQDADRRFVSTKKEFAYVTDDR
jgi:putative transposase